MNARSRNADVRRGLSAPVTRACFLTHGFCTRGEAGSALGRIAFVAVATVTVRSTVRIICDRPQRRCREAVRALVASSPPPRWSPGFFRLRLTWAICVRSGLGIGLQWVGADGRSAAAKPLAGLDFGMGAGRCGRHGRLLPVVFCHGVAWGRVDGMVRVSVRPSLSKLISMPILRTKVAARRSLPDSARGLCSQTTLR
jgi:hypothetical protein